MKLLILTQKVNINDDLLGFMHSWILEFSKKCEKVTVICLEKGEYDLPDNVKILSLGKEKTEIRNLKFEIWKKIIFIFYFYKYIISERRNYDAVFVHMNHEYVILGGLIWKLLGKKIGLWYAHGYVPKSLKISEKLADHIFTSTKSGFRLNSKKLNVVGQGTDVEKFKVESSKSRLPQPGTGGQVKVRSEILRIITVGRIAPSKDYLTLVKAAEILDKSNIKFNITVVGGVAMARHENYFNQLKEKVIELGLTDLIKFTGMVAHKDILGYLLKSDLFVNMSHTGSLDKVILEAMACELPILTCNEALEEVLENFKEKLMFKKGDFQGLAEKILYINGLSDFERLKMGGDLRQIVIKNHSLAGLISKIISIYGKEN